MNLFFWKKEQKKDTESKYEEIKFEHLAPIDTVEDEVTFNALDYALSQNNIRNIAVTGNYGSGKSSVLQSYIKQNKKNKFLNISLATFAIEEKDEKKVSSDDKLPETTIQKIEKSILQQIFYRKAGSKFPYSRFNRIMSLSFWHKIGIEFILIFLILFPIKILKNDIWIKFKEALTISFNKETSNFVFGVTGKTFLLAVFFIITFLIALYNIISIFNRIRLTKFSFQKAEFGLGDVKEESLLNKYLDEVLYFFEATEYDVVVIEDLDRFKNTEIFIKLRELNTLLNNYEKIKRRIVFIYALRDEVFKDSSRTKFFEFIIPIIPVINTQNSSDKLLEAQTQNSNSVLAKLDKNFLQDVGLYIDDMRLLKNCINEFKIYDKKINADDYSIKEYTEEKKSGQEISHNRNKIFALILYKNLYPEDFAKLSCNEGELYSIFQAKSEIIKNKINEVEKEIIPLEQEVKDIEKQIDIDIKELRLIYIAKIFSKKQADTYIKDNVQDFVTDEKFLDLRNNTTFSGYILSRNTYPGSMQVKTFTYNFSNIEKEINSDYSYDQREMFLTELKRNKIRELQSIISEKKNLIANITQMSISELMKEIPSEKFIKNISKLDSDFIVFLLRNGYIDENYFDYISYFYPGALSSNDRNFLLLLQNYQQPQLDLQLNNIENVLRRIKNSEWALPAILNYSLLSYLLKNNNTHVKDIAKALWEYKSKTHPRNILFNYINTDEKQLKIFYSEIYLSFNKNANWIKILFDNEDISVIYKFFMAIDIKKTDQDIKAFLTKDISFLHRTLGDELLIIKKINSLGLKFMMTEETPNYPIYSIIVNNNAYTICKKNLEIILNNESKNPTIPINNYYTLISKLENKTVKEYINQNLELFVKDIVLTTDNLTEDEESVLKLLNSEQVSDDLKKSMIEKNNCVISDITKISLKTSDEETEENADKSCINLWDVVITNKKIIPTWKNIFEYFKHCENKLTENLINLFNDKSIVGNLTKEKPLSDEEMNNKSENYDVANNLYSCILKSGDLLLESYSALMKVCPWYYTNLSKYDISIDKMRFLIKEKKISLTKENYAGVKNSHLTLIPQFISTRFSSFIKNELELDFSVEDALLLLESSELMDEQKKQLLTVNFTVWNSFTTKENLLIVAKRIIELNFTEKTVINLSLLIDSLDNENELIKKMSLQHKFLSKEMIEKTINSKFSNIHKLAIERKGKTKRIPYSSQMMNFYKLLERKDLISTCEQKGDRIIIHQKRK